jgi:putative ABC transport system permease protein
MNGLGWIGRDVRDAARSLLRDRGSVALALLALALGIGATTVIFSVVYSVFVNTFPFDDPSRVVHFYIQAPNQPGRSAWYPAPEFDEYRARNSVFSAVLGGASFEALYNLENATYRVRGALIDPHALPALGVEPVLGRTMTEADGAPGAPPTFLMSDRMWKERFNRDPNVLGTTLKINGTYRTLIAVLPPRFLLHGADVFFPTTITAHSTAALIGGPATQPLFVWTYGVLKPGVTKEQAAANVEVIARNQARLSPNRYPPKFTVTVMTLADAYTSVSLQEMVYILTGAVAMLLLIACSNVANLLLARAAARETELALRAGLGASRMRLMSLLLTESFVLAVIGTAIGGLFAYAGLQWVKAAIPADALPAELGIRFSHQALYATIGVTFLVTLLCGFVPAWRAARGNLQARLMSTGKGVGLRAGHAWLRTLLVAVQVTLAIVLLVGAGLMMRTLFALQDIDLGLNPSSVLVGQFGFPQEQTRTPAQRTQFVRQVVDKVRMLPGVAAVSPSVTTPIARSFGSPLSIPGTSPTGAWRTALELVGEDYFRALGIPLVAGRLLAAPDVDGARRFVVVNQRFARTFLGGANPIGRTVTFALLDQMSPPDQRAPFEIVGVVGDTRNAGIEDDVQPQAFAPYTLSALPTAGIVVKTSVDPMSLQHGVMQQVWAVDHDVALMNTMSLEDVLEREAFAAPKFGVGLLSTFAAVGLVLAAIGVFSVMAYTVSLQTRDIGIRIALGAEPRGVTRMLLLRGLRPIAAGVIAGIGASYALSRLMAHQIYGVTTTDPWTFAIVVAVLAVVGVLACLLPARRATKVDPLIALRSE